MRQIRSVLCIRGRRAVASWGRLVDAQRLGRLVDFSGTNGDNSMLEGRDPPNAIDCGTRNAALPRRMDVRPGMT